jgi:hypothetical protein
MNKESINRKKFTVVMKWLLLKNRKRKMTGKGHVGTFGEDGNVLCQNYLTICNVYCM